MIIGGLRLSLVQEQQQNIIGARRAHTGEYVGERGWSWTEEGTPLAELAFRAQQEKLPNSPWVAYLGGDFDDSLLGHREVLIHYRSRW